MTTKWLSPMTTNIHMRFRQELVRNKIYIYNFDGIKS